MALQHLRSSTANKRPTPAAMSDGQLAMNTNLASPGLFLKDSNGDLVKVGPVHVGPTAPNATPAASGQTGNSVGEQWLDNSSSRYVFKVWDGSAWRTEDGEFVNASGDTMTGALVMDNQQQVRFRETTGNGTNFIAIQAPASVASDRTLTLPDVTGTIVSTGDTGTVTSTMILDGTILNADVNASAAIAGTKISPDFGSQTIATTGVFSHALGAAATPSITFTGDLNTGIYSPGADQVAVATNGTGRLFVDASGRVGVGVGSPVTALQVVGTATFGNGVGGRLQATTDSNLGYIDSLNNTSTEWQPLLQRGTEIQFHTNTAGVTPAVKATITSAGLVGIGTSAPSEKLDVFAGSLSVGSHYVATVNTDYKIRLRSVGAATNNNFTAEIGIAGGGAQPAESSLTFATQTWNGSAYVVTEKMRVDPAGRVGIGTTSPGSALDVAGEIRIYPASGDANLRFGSGGVEKGRIAVNSSSNCIIETAGTERVRIDSSGRFLVGTSTSLGVATSLGGQFQVADTSVGIGSITTFANSANGGFLMLGKSRGATVGSYTVVQNNDQLGTIRFGGADGTDLESFGASIEAQVDGTPGANDMPGRLVFSTTADGASSPTERMRIDALGALKTSPNGTYKFPAGTTEITHNDATSSIQLIASSTSFTGDAVTISTYRNTVNDSYKFLSCIRQGFAVALEIRDDGDVYNVNGTYGSLSDVKLKENIVDANSQWDDIRQLRVRNYNFKPETNNSTHKQIGVIAQEIEDVSPGLVNTVPDRDEEGNDLGTVTKSVNYSVLYMKAVKALQEAMERIETLEARLTAAGIE